MSDAPIELVSGQIPSEDLWTTMGGIDSAATAVLKAKEGALEAIFDELGV